MFQVRSRKSMLLLVCLTLVLSSVGYLYTSVQRNSRVMMLKTDIVQSEKEKLLKTIVQTSDKLSTFILIASPSVVKGSELRKTIGFKASESVFSPTKALYVPPVLPQSALINSLKLNPQIELIGQLQAYLESFSQLLVPNQKQFRQIQRNNSVLWNNLKINAQRAAGIFVYNQRTLEKEGEEDLQNDILFQLLQNNLLALVKIAKTADSLACLRIVEDAMNNLLAIANMKSLEKQICRTNYMVRVRTNLPKLCGRTKIIMRFQLLHDGESDGSSSVSSSYSTNISYAKGTVHEVTIMVDGTNYPITAGNFVDLCNKRFYDTLPIASRSLEVGGEVVPLTVLGEYSPGYVDPVTQKQRRLPLEVLREGATRSSEVYAVAPPYQGSSNALRYTATGGSLNSAVFTKAKPVQSFATVRDFCSNLFTLAALS